VTSTAERAAAQAAFWNGPGGKMWLAAYERRIARDIAPFGDAALQRAGLAPGEKVIDVGCGTGETTQAIAAAVVPGGEVLGLDISEALLEAARARNISGARFMAGDATTLALPPAAFDVLYSRFGVMFFADPVAAFANLRGALRPDGRVSFVCWRTPAENPWGLVPIRAAMPHLPPMERPGPEDPGQYAFGDRARVERILGEAGFAAPTFEPMDRPMRLGHDVPDVLENLGRFGPLARAFADAAPGQVARAQQAIAEALAPHATADGVALAGAVWLVQTTRR
jgi:SAM-dependent methyltransferase